MFSFFAVPILLGDITIDFMQMIDVMVMVMVDIMGEEGEEGDGNNNNNNNNGEGAIFFFFLILNFFYHFFFYFKVPWACVRQWEITIIAIITIMQKEDEKEGNFEVEIT